MSILIFKDTSVVLSTLDDRALPDASHLILEISSNGQVVDKVNLLPRESSPGVWDADDLLCLSDLSTDFRVSVSMGLDGKRRQVLGFIELKGTTVYTGKAYEIPLKCHGNYPKLIVKTRSLGVDEIQDWLSETSQSTASSVSEDEVERLYDEGIAR